MEKISTKKQIALCGALVMFSFNVTNAQIISTDFNHAIMQSCTMAAHTYSHKLDLNNDGIRDFSLDLLSSEPNPTCCVPFNDNSVSETPVNTKKDDTYNSASNQLQWAENHEILATDNFIQIYPNPFSEATSIAFSLNQSEKVSMWIIDLKGILIKSMLNDYLEAGDYLIQCNSENLKAGIYFLQIKAGETLTTQKLIVTK